MLLRLATALLLVTGPAIAGDYRPVSVAKASWCSADGFDPSPVIRGLNELRRQQGLPPVSGDEALHRAAHAHSQDLAGWGKLSHAGSDGSSFVVRVERASFNGTPRAENVAWNLPSADAVVRAWDRSPGHQANMLLPDVTHVGIGYSCSPSKGRFWTMVLGRRDRGVELAALD